MASRSWNRVELIGNLTRDPELRFTSTGTAVATFGLATNRTYVVEGERKEEVDFHKIVAWNKLAELCQQLLKKGSRVFISGRLQYREWEPQEGGKRRDAEIVLEDMILITPKGESTVESRSEGIDLDSLPDVGGETPALAASGSAPADDVGKSSSSSPKKASEEETPKPAPATETVDESDLPF
ncbi:MAG: single-stranded DNA-binding protein [bacterium]|nr:single-stranded DNA-binding protein [bacterium]